MMYTHFSRWFRLGATAGWSSRAVVLSLVLMSSLVQAADPATTCETAKLKAAGKMADCLAKAEAKALLGKPSNPLICVTAFSKAFTKAEANAALAGGACPVMGDVKDVEALVDTCVDDWAATIAGTPPPPCAGTQFPASGQTTPYTADKNDGIAGAVAVPDDGTLEAGATLSYTDNGLTVTDNNTGLEWEKKTSLDSTTNFANLHDADNYYHWSGNGSQETIWDWIEDVNAEGGTGYAGHNDWRIPNIKELQSIADYSIPYPGPVVNPVFGPMVVASLYWSSTSHAYYPSDAWDVDFVNGNVTNNHKSNNLFVRAVRGGS